MVRLECTLRTRTKQCFVNSATHYSDVIMGTIVSQSPASRSFTQPFIQARRSKKTTKLSVIGLCAGTSPVTGEFPAQMASNAENVSIWWRHHEAWFSLYKINGTRHTTRYISNTCAQQCGKEYIYTYKHVSSKQFNAYRDTFKKKTIKK